MRFRCNTEIAIHVTDLAEAESFYAGVLGFDVVDRTETMLAFDAGKLRLYVNLDATVRPFIPSLDVSDASAAKEHLARAGCRVEREGEAGFYFTDPFGLTLDVVQRE